MGFTSGDAKALRAVHNVYQTHENAQNKPAYQGYKLCNDLKFFSSVQISRMIKTLLSVDE